MKIWFELPIISEMDLYQLQTDQQQLNDLSVIKLHKTFLGELGRWFRSIGEEIPNIERVKWYKDYITLNLRTAIQLNMSEETLILFKLKYNVSTQLD